MMIRKAKGLGYLLFLLFWPVFGWGQTSDTLRIGGRKLPYYHLSIDAHSAAQPAIVLVTTAGTFPTLKKQLLKYCSAYKQEFTDYHLLALDHLTERGLADTAVIDFLNRIDSARMSVNRSTFLRAYRLDKASGKITYGAASHDWRTVSNLFFVKQAADVCRYIRCK